MRLDEVKINQIVIIENILGKDDFKKRLLEMGLTPKTHVQVKRKAPLGDPIIIEVRKYRLILRKKQASCIVVKEVEQNEENCSCRKSKLREDNTF